MSDSKEPPAEPQFKGWLYKWTNYLKGYQKRWFVLSSNGLLSYYRTHAEVAHTCRGTISLRGAFIHTEDSCNLTISNGGTRTFHLKAQSEVDRQRWVTALELAKAKSIRQMEDEEEEDLPERPDKHELHTTLRALASKLDDLNTCNELIMKHGATLQRALNELEALNTAAAAATEHTQKMKSVNERSTLFRITANAMINACSDYLSHAQSQGRRWQRALLHEHEQRLRLEEMVEQLAKQHSHLEMEARKESKTVQQILSTGGAVTSDEDDEFLDAVENHPNVDFEVEIPAPRYHR
ncbi:PREDICTED: oxysterol-binding protein 1-like isoform X2 [Priapulus caudatus]|nr:PREDICTED: oxysterol-binding protein 1-like isoform X2 [Priapulus caudatus]